MPLPLAAAGQAAPALAPADAQALVERALANELRAAQDTGHPVRYRLRKTSPRLTSTKLMVETSQGLVARLVAIDGQPLSAVDEQKEQSRLDGLLSDPSRQRHRKQGEDADAGRALKVLRALPKAFLYEYAGTQANPDAPGSSLVKFTFKPNPKFNPPDLETQTLTVMTGEILIDPVQERVAHLEGRLEQDVDFGWGILGRLNKGGWIAIEQAGVGGGAWHVVRLKMEMSGRVFFKAKVFDTAEEESDFSPLPVGLGYEKAIEMLRAGDGAAEHSSP